MSVKPTRYGLDVGGLKLSKAEVTALREHFRRETDARLGRDRASLDSDFAIYRKPENDDEVIGYCIRVVNEHTGDSRTFWAGTPPPNTPEGNAARDWFDYQFERLKPNVL